MKAQDASLFFVSESRWDRLEAIDPVQQPLFVNVPDPAVELVGVVASPGVASRWQGG